MTNIPDKIPPPTDESVRNFVINIVRGNGVFIFPDGAIRGDIDGTKISVIETDGWEQLDYDRTLTVKDLIPKYVIQEIDICDLLDQYVKLVGVENFIERFYPNPMTEKEVA